MVFELGSQMVMGTIAFGNYQYPGSILVKAMDDPRTEGTAVIWQ
jgi:hypothetical protein